MNKQVLLIGASGGLGQACLVELENRGYSVHTLTRQQLDLDHPGTIFDHDFSKFNVLINCAGHNKGTYRGFLHNTWENQLSQITVNYISNLFLLKHFANSVKVGKYVWIGSSSINNPRPYHSVYAGSKMASKFAIDLVRPQAEHIQILEVNVGTMRTNFRNVNFEGSQTTESINIQYDQETALDPVSVSNQIITAMEQDQTELLIR